MTRDTANTAPHKSVWRRFIILVPLVIVLSICSWTYIWSVRSTYTAQTDPVSGAKTYESYGIDDITYDVPGVVEATSVEHDPSGAASVTFRALGDGETTVTFGDDRLAMQWSMRVHDGAIIEDEVNFSGWESVLLSLCIFLIVLTALFASALLSLVRRAWFDYNMMACGGGFLFSLFQIALFTYHLVTGTLVDFLDLAILLNYMADYFLILTFIPLSVLALLLSISNIWLIRHEGRHPINLLGIGLSVVWLAVLYLYYLWQTSSLTLSLPYEFVEVASCLVSVAITYGECLLLSTILCAWAASCHVPKRTVDYLVILGCGIRPDGSPTPLLAGRVDKAYQFDITHVAAGDKPVAFVPSGGKGSDEIISEAQSMRNYLVEKGVEPERIVLEDRSTNTRENMAYSRQVIEHHAGRDVTEVSVAFSTTNYHVFRGYVYAHQAGMMVEGMGSKTKAYFWPNAFLREFAGLLVAEWKSILQTYLTIAAIYVFAEYILVLA